MVDVSKAYPNPVNIDALLETVRAQYPQVSQGDTGFRVHHIAPENEGTASAALDAIIAAHNAATLTQDQQVQSAAIVALAQGKDYLRRQLLNPSPDTQVIVSVLSTAINGNAHLLQMFTNQRNLMIAANAWGSIDTATAVGRARYILVVEMVIALLG